MPTHQTARWNYPVVNLDGEAMWLDEAPQIKITDLATGEHPVDDQGEFLPVIAANAAEGWIEVPEGETKRRRIEGAYAITSNPWGFA